MEHRHHNIQEHDERAHSHQHHQHHHGHSHHHHHAITDTSELTRSFLWGIGLNILYVILEAVFGFIYDSMGLLSDSGHNLSDVAALLLSLIAVRLALKKPDERFTYGFKKSTILISVLNAVILFIAVGFIVFECIEKLITPEKVNGLAVALIAGIGVVVNGLTMLLFRKGKEGDLNVKGAYLHMLADALVSIGVVISGIVIHFTGWYIIDPLIGLGVAVIIVFSAWGLLKESITLSMDGVPEGINVENIREQMMKNPEVEDVHHIHIWSISTTENALTAHIRLKNIVIEESVKQNLKDILCKNGISHSTLEFETHESCCVDDIISED